MLKTCILMICSPPTTVASAITNATAINFKPHAFGRWILTRFSFCYNLKMTYVFLQFTLGLLTASLFSCKNEKFKRHTFVEGWETGSNQCNVTAIMKTSASSAEIKKQKSITSYRSFVVIIIIMLLSRCLTKFLVRLQLLAGCHGLVWRFRSTPIMSSSMRQRVVEWSLLCFRLSYS